MYNDPFLKKAIMEAEGEIKSGGRHVVYKDSLGLETVGYGRLLSRGFSQDEVELMLTNDIYDSVKELDKNLPWWRGLPETKMRALAEMCFNLGYPRLSGFKKMLKALERRDYPEAARQALDSKWARQVKGRADRIADLIRSTD